MIRILAFILTLVLAPLSVRAQDVPMAMNLSRVNDWSAQQPFIDVMKTARRWIGHKPGQWGGVQYDELEERGLLDENGWPIEIPADLSSIGTLILTDLPEDAAVYAGRYVLSFAGEGIVEVGGGAQNVRYGTGQVTFDFSPGGAVLLKIQRTDPSRTGDYVRNISVMKQENAQAWQAGAVFNPDWLRHMEGFEAIRFMNWMNTNNSTQERWEDRPRLSDFSYSWRGVPLEVMLALANRLNAAPWFNMPHLADDAYCRAFARAVSDGLDGGLDVYVEYSNEMWNFQFDQTRWAETQARARWGREHRFVEHYGMRAAQIAQIWSDVFAAKRDRLINVISTQTGWMGLEKDILEAPLWVAENPESNAPPHEYFDAYAVTGYFGHALGTDKRRDLVESWIESSHEIALQDADGKGLAGEAKEAHIRKHRYDAASEWAAQELYDGSITEEREGSLADLLDRVLPYHVNIARSYDLEMIMYEGGTHVVGTGLQMEAETLTDFFTHLNYTPEMGRLYENLIAGWKNLGVGLFTPYSDVLVPTKSGSWGHLRHLGDDNPRWRALLQFQQN
ncbi:hypothetical protein ACEWPM_009125 [Roseovarius sp. S4756]|uniref:hypothetical protein n=1 Tax=Roseovarius maritimus TaxID=3342637 RepID=UPI00372B24FE